MNNVKTVLLLATISGLLIAIGGLLMGLTGVILFGAIAAAMNFGSYWFSSDLMLRMAHAHEISREQDPTLFSLVERLTRDAEMPMPRVYVIDSPQPNAFATGRSPKHAAIAVTVGIRKLLNERELRGVLAHELAHVSNRDTLISAVAATMASAISMIGWVGLWFGGSRRGGNGMLALVAVILAPIAAMIIRAAISRSREYQADRDGARFVQDPEGLASALGKLETGVRHTPMDVREPAAHLFIINPLKGGGVAGMFSSHPPTEERIRRLRALTPDELLRR